VTGRDLHVSSQWDRPMEITLNAICSRAMTARRIGWFVLVWMALFTPAASVAQHPRLVLIEEGTNASCEPCARQNPILEEFLEKGDVEPFVIPLVYHAFWPGPDTMNERAPEMNDARIRGYYGMFGMPSVVVNGQQYPSGTPGLGAGAPADTIAVRRLVDSLRALTSPILLTIDDTIDGDRLIARTRVVSSSHLEGRLRIALVERHHRYVAPPAGNNGEIDFPWTVRAMLPDAAGRELSLAPDAELIVTDTVAIDDEWHRRDLYVVAFVQNDDTREVLQAASTREHLTITPAGRTSARIRDVGSSGVTWTASAEATRSGRFLVRIETELPEGWSISLGVDGLATGDSALVDLDASRATPIVVTITPAIDAPGRGIARISLHGERGAVDTLELRLYAGDIGIPLFAWHERNHPDVPDRYVEALERTRHRFTVIPRADDDLFDFTDHSLIVVAAGDDTLDAGQRARLAAFLDRMGRLLISGSQIAQSLGDPEYDQTGMPRDTSFLHTYLHASYVAPTSATLAVNGVRNDPIGASIGFVLEAGQRAPGTPDRIRPLRNALPVFHYGSARDSIGALRYGRPEHRVVYFGFGAEAIADVVVRAGVLERSLDWLLGGEITAGIESATDVGVALAPNPAHDVVRVSFDAPSASRIFLVSALGDVARRVEIERGSSVVDLDVSGLPRGVYAVVIEGSGQRTTERLIVR
jgi:hypothetical protein